MYGSWCGYHLSSRYLGRRRESRGTWNPEEKGRWAILALASLNRDPCGPPSSCHLEHLRAPVHLEPWKGMGRAVFCILLPSLLWRFSGDGATKKFPRLTLGQVVQKRSSLWRVYVLFSCTHTFTSSSRILQPWLLKTSACVYILWHSHRRRGLLSSQCCSFLASHWIGWRKGSQDRLTEVWQSLETGRRFLGLCCWPNSVLCFQCCWPNSGFCFHWMSWLFLYHFLVSELPSLLSVFLCPIF